MWVIGRSRAEVEHRAHMSCIFDIGGVANGALANALVVSKAIEGVGDNGVITIEEGKSLTTEMELVDGMQFDRGYLSPYFVTNAEKMVAELEDPYILIHEKKLSSLQPMLPILEAVVQAGRPLVIIAEEVEGEALATLVVNKLRGILNIVAVKAPGFGDRRKAMCEDIAILTGGKFISEDLGLKLENLELTDLGRAKATRVIHAEGLTVVPGFIDLHSHADGGGEINIEFTTALPVQCRIVRVWSLRPPAPRWRPGSVECCGGRHVVDGYSRVHQWRRSRGGCA